VVRGHKSEHIAKRRRERFLNQKSLAASSQGGLSKKAGFSVWFDALFPSLAAPPNEVKNVVYNIASSPIFRRPRMPFGVTVAQATLTRFV
jgi:hypothetical protein